MISVTLLIHVPPLTSHLLYMNHKMTPQQLEKLLGNLLYLLIDLWFVIYLVDAEGMIRRFHDIKMEWGFDKFFPLDSFNVLPNGYLVNDCCVFGAEVFVHERSAKRDNLSMIKEPSNRIMTWKIENFSTQQDKVPIYSRIYVVGDLKWYCLFIFIFLYHSIHSR